MRTGLPLQSPWTPSLQLCASCVDNKESPARLALPRMVLSSPSSSSTPQSVSRYPGGVPRRRSSDHTPSLHDFDGLLAAAQRGEDAAWNVLIGSVAGQLLGYARSKGAPDPEDAVGEVFLRITKKIADFDGDEADFRAWTFTIMHRLVIDDYRKRSVRPQASDDDSEIDRAVSADDPEAAVLARFSTGEASALIDELPIDQAEVIRLSVLGQLSTAQIATMLGKKQGGVRALRFRALKRLTRTLEEVAPS